MKSKEVDNENDLEMVADLPSDKNMQSVDDSCDEFEEGGGKQIKDNPFEEQEVISRSHSLDESQEDPTEKLIDKKKEAAGRTSDQMYHKELAMAFPFLKNIDITRKSRMSNQRLSRLSKQQPSEGLEFVRTSRTSKKEDSRKNQFKKQQTFKKQTLRLEQEQNLDRAQGFGLGIISFHQFMALSGILFLLLTLMHIPVFMIFLSQDKTYENLKGMNSAEDKSLLERFTLGNLGFASSECQVQSLVNTVVEKNEVKIRCKTGILSNLIDFGIATKAEDQNQCRRKSTDICNKYLIDKGQNSLQMFYERNCQGKDSCLIPEFDNFVNKKGDAQEIYACLAPESSLFLQYQCEHTDEQIKQKIKVARTLVIIELACIAVVVLFIFFVKNRTHALAKKYIKKHVQAMDYTMFVPIQKSQLKRFDQEFYKPNSKESRGMQFKNHLTEHLCQMTSNVAGRDNQDVEIQNDHNWQISRIDLVFDNNNLLHLLKSRGRAIMYEDKDEVQKYEAIINDKEYKDRQYFCKIVGAFVTYECKDDVTYIHMAAKKKTSYLGKKVKIKQAQQPYHYTWENMAFTMRRKCCGFMCSMLLLLTFLLIAFTIQFKMQKTVAYFDNYERGDCNVFKDSVSVANDEQVKTPSVYIIPDFSYPRFQREAYSTWKNFYDETDTNDMTKRYVNATLSCFCEIKYSKWNFLLLFAEYRADGLDQAPAELEKYQQQLKKDKKEDEVETNYICSQFIIYSKMSSNYYLMMSVVIFLFNLGLYELTGPILSITGFSRKSKQQNLVSIIIMICLLIDTILIPVMIGANFVEYGNRSILDQVFTGKNTDFGKDWYPDVGYGFIITMILYILNPFFTVFAEWGDLQFRKCWRRKCNKKLKQKQDFSDMRYYMFDIGPTYIMDYKIASTTSLFFIAIVFGPLVPLLYPMAFFAIIIQYFVEVASLRRFYKLNDARKQDEMMTIVNLKILLIAPLMGIAVTIWAYSNRQMFENVIDPVKSMGEVVLSHHLLTDKKYPNYSHVILLKLGLLITGGGIAFIIVQSYFFDLAFKRKRFKDMPDYTNSLRMDRCEEMLEDEKFFAKRGGFSIMPPQALAKLKNRVENKDIEGNSSKEKLNDSKSKIQKKLQQSDSINSSSVVLGSQQGRSNQLIGQPSYMAAYDIDYQFMFNDKEDKGLAAIKLLLMLPMIQQDKLDKIKIQHYKYGKDVPLA